MPTSIHHVNRRHLLSLAAASGAALAATALAGPLHAAAPLRGIALAKHWRYKLGAFEVTTIADSEAFIDGPYPIIGKNASEAEVRALMRDNLVPETRYQPGFSPTLVNTGKELVLFDTGNGATGFVARPQGGWLAAQLGPAGFKPEDVDVVVLSHGHLDHVAGIMEDGRPLFPNARYIIAATEFDFWKPEGRHSGEMEKLAAVFRSSVLPVADKCSMIKPGDDIVPGIRSLAAPGHTPGHLAFVIESEGRHMLFWGDCAHHHVASLARPDWHCVFDVDPEQGAATRKTIYDMAATERWAVIGYHMPFPSVGYVERRGERGYRWLPHSFQLYE
jgi:glyoxylase-like metal-dependent hydrolase (beta-lactamase superfamily II)